MKLFIAIIGFSILASCQSNTYEEISSKKTTNPTYLRDVKPIIDSKCISCHSPTGVRSDYQLVNYAQVKASAELSVGNGGILCYIDNPTACSSSAIMPPSGRMAQSLIDLIKLWKQQGLAN